MEKSKQIYTSKETAETKVVPVNRPNPKIGVQGLPPKQSKKDFLLHKFFGVGGTGKIPD
jgi:hypothetical protein